MHALALVASTTLLLASGGLSYLTCPRQIVLGRPLSSGVRWASFGLGALGAAGWWWLLEPVAAIFSILTLLMLTFSFAPFLALATRRAD